VVSILAQVGTGNLWERQRFAQSTGSGVIISPDGFIVTNHHVIDKSSTIKVTLNNKKEFEARLIGSDPSTDLALLKIDSRDLPFLVFGNSDSLQIGEWVLAVGNPFRLESTVTAGIVSAKGRNINILDADYPIESFIQTDAVVNPGNSGGALVNSLGELVGINTAIITQSGKYEGYSFAVPSNLVQKVVYDLREYGRVQRGLLGVSIANVSSEQAKEFLLPAVNGVVLQRVSPGGAADLAGLKRNDVLVAVNGVATSTVPELQEIVGRYRPGDTLNVQYYRRGEVQNAKVILKNPFVTTLADIGFELRDFTLDELKSMNKKGVLVVSIYKGSRIERTNMDPGFVITKVNDKTVETVEQVIKEIRNSRKRVVLEGFYKRYPGEYYYAFSVD
jgi:Do/DeqQ family serine protease